VTCIGGATVDRKYRALGPVRLETSNPVTTSQRSFGGVARNVAENIVRLGVKASLVSIVGNDENGRAVLEDLKSLGIDTRHVAVSGDHATAEYVAVLQPDGDVAIGLADMAIFDDLTPTLLRTIQSDLSSAWIFADCNAPSETLHELISLAHRRQIMLVLDAVSAPKVMRLPRNLSGVGLLFLNRDEAQAFLGISIASPADAVEALLDCGAARVVLTLGPEGIIAADRSGVVRIGASTVQVVDATGAGDALIAATLVAMLGGHSFTEAARLGTMAAALTTESLASVRPDLSLTLLETAMSRRAHNTFERELS
jgi:pseudouridine kinase